MASNCKACTDLREYAPEFVMNGVTDNVCLSLENDNGLGNHEDHTDCDDLHDAVDCLVGNMDDEIEAYEICGWKLYMHKLVPNLHMTIKAVICAVCGLWNNICRLWCWVNYLVNGVTIEVGESYKETDDIKIYAGKGVSFLIRGSTSHEGTDVILKSYGNMLRLAGSLTFFTGGNWDDVDEVGNFDNGAVARRSKTRKGNNVWDTNENHIRGGELAYEIRLPKKQYPFIKDIKQGWGTGSISGMDFTTLVVIFDGDGNCNNGVYAYGQHGACNTETGASVAGSDEGHLVEPNYWYIQMRIKGWRHNDTDVHMGSVAGPELYGGGEARTPMALMCMEVDPENGVCGPLGNHEDCEMELHQGDVE